MRTFYRIIKQCRTLWSGYYGEEVSSIAVRAIPTGIVRRQETNAEWPGISRDQCGKAGHKPGRIQHLDNLNRTRRRNDRQRRKQEEP